jgi:hypothetical protein
LKYGLKYAAATFAAVAGSRFRNGARELHEQCGKRALFLKAAVSLFF